MKHTFSTFLSAGLVLGALMAIISCSNVLDASLKDPSGSSADSGKMPVLYVTASVSAPSRTILPSDWTEERASALVYQITDDDSDAVIADKLTYAELKAGLTLYLEVKAWNLTLTGYEPAADGTSADNTKPVLSAKATADLSGGAAAVTFNLQPAASTLAKGDVDVSVTFYDIDEIKKISYGLFDSSDAGAGEVDGKVKKVEKNPDWNGVDGVSEANNVTNQWKIQYTTDAAAAGGDSFFGVIFYNDKDQVLATYFDRIRIDAGNVSEAVIKLEKDIYNKIPAAPDNFAVTKTIFNDDGSGDSKYQVINGTTLAADTLYKAVFTWDDKSDNETGFVIKITGGTAPLEIDSSATTQTDVKLAAAGELAAGSLSAGSTTATIWLETGETYTATINANNSFGDSSDDACADEINLFTVTYQLDEGQVKFGAAAGDVTTAATDTAFVLPYNKSVEAQPLLSADTADIPHVFRDNYKFYEWQNTASMTPGPGTPVTEIAASNAANMDVTAVWQSGLTVNVTLPSYSEPQNVKLFKDLINAQVIEAPLRSTPLGTVDGSVTVTLDTTTYTALSNMEYTVYGLDGKTELLAKNGVVDDTNGTLTWTFNDTLTAGTYPVYVKADYEFTDNTVTKTETLSGYLYIKITE